MKTPLFLTKHVKRLPRAIFACAVALVFCPPLVYAQDIVVTEPSLSFSAAFRENKNISLPEPPAFLKKMEARNSGDWGAPPTCAYAIITQYIDKDGTPESSLFYGTHRELLNAMPDGFEKQKFKLLKSPAVRRFWYAVIYNPPAAAANAPDAAPRLLAVSPVEFSREVFEAVKESEKTVRGNAQIDAKGKPAVSFVEFSREKFEAVRGREQTVWGNAQIDAKGKLAEYTLDPQYAYANAWKPAIDDALKQWKFAPARAGGKRVAATLRLPVRLPALPTKIFRGAADRRPAAGGDASYFEPALVDEDTVELPAYKVVGERILPPPESWLYTAIPGFEVLSNASSRQTRKFVRDFLEFQTALGMVWPTPASANNVRVPTLMIVCGKAGSYESLRVRTSRGTNNAVHHRNGFFVEDDERSAIVIDYDFIDNQPGMLASAADPYRRLYNQYARFHMRRSLGGEKPPDWLEEGLARLVETIDFSQKHIEFARIDESLFHGYGMMAPGMLSIDIPFQGGFHHPAAGGYGSMSGLPMDLRYSGARYLMPLDKMFSKDVRGGSGSMGWSTQCYVFVHMCLYGTQKKYQRGFIQFASHLMSEPVTEELFKQCFGRTYKQMAVEMRSYLQIAFYQSILYKVPRGRKLFSELDNVAVRDATQAEIGRIKGEVLRLGGRPVDSRNEFNTPYLRGEREPALLASLGLLESLEKREDRALKFLEAAARANAERPRAYLELAKIRLRKTQAAMDNPAGRLDATQAAFVMEPLMAARRQQPPMRGVYSLIGDILLRGAAKPGGEQLKLMLEGVRFFPHNIELLHKTATLCLDNGNPEQASVLIEHGLKITQVSQSNEEFEKLRARLPAAIARKAAVTPEADAPAKADKPAVETGE